MRYKALSRTFTDAQAGTVLVDVGSLWSIRLAGVIFAAHADNSVSPAMSVGLGGDSILSHPGVPAGGGLVATGLDVWGAQGADLTFDCDVPSGGSVSVTIIYRTE